MSAGEPDALGGGVWVVAEHARGEPARVALELAGEARRLARELGCGVAALALGDALESLSAPLAQHGADAVVLVEHPALARYDPEIWLATLSSLCDAHAPRLVLFAATPQGSDAALRLALARGLPLVPRCVDLRIRGGDFELVRALLGGAAHEVLAGAGPGPRLATIAPDALGLGAPDASRSARVLRVEAVVPEHRRIQPRGFAPGDPRALDLGEAEVVVAAGRGVASREGLALVDALADALGASVGGSRVAVDQGWVPRERQIGQTGRTVRPRLYVACGISGAAQHVIGMRESGTVIAINRDAAAPIFRVAHLGVEADLHALLPRLAARCREERERG